VCVCVLTSVEEQLQLENAAEEATGVYSAENSKNDLLTKCRDAVCGDSNEGVTRSANLKFVQHYMPVAGQSTDTVNKGHVCNVCKKVFSQRRHLVRHKLKHNTSSGEQSAKGSMCAIVISVGWHV
jgi:hypothetical protein